MPDPEHRREEGGRLFALPRALFFWSAVSCLLIPGPVRRFFLPAPHDFSRTPRGHMLGSDFVNFWTGSRLMLEGKILSLFDLDKYIAAMNGYFGVKLPPHNWSYPPVTLLFTALFGLPPYFWALALWSVAGVAAFMAACRCGGRQPLPWVAAAAVALLSPAGFFNLFGGQNGFFTAALFLGGFHLLERREKTAGVLFGLLCIKPQLGLLIPLALVVLEKPKAFLAAAGTAVLLVAASVALWGLAPWRLYLGRTLPFQSLFLREDWHEWGDRHHIFSLMMPGAYADAHMSGLSPAVSMIACVLAACAAVAASLFILRREGATPRGVLALAIAAILATPYAFNYDMMAVTGALAVYLADTETEELPRLFVFGPLWALPMFILMIRVLHLPLGAAVLLGVLGWLVRESRRKQVAA